MLAKDFEESWNVSTKITFTWFRVRNKICRKRKPFLRKLLRTRKILKILNLTADSKKSKNEEEVVKSWAMLTHNA